MTEGSGAPGPSVPPDARARIAVGLGPDVIERLLPHRRPFLMIDRIVDYARGPKPSLSAQRHISSNESVFEGHFPGMHLWPGVYTIEGMGQTCNALAVICALEAHASSLGKPIDLVVEGLRNAERGARLEAGFRPDLASEFDALVKGLDPRARRGLAARVDVRFVQPVFAGERIDFRVTETKTFGALAQFDVEATVEGRVVARGALTGAHSAPELERGP